ncbi:threonine/serine exporter family protein [Auraticoccus sp. F435]|uniref:Threonine/serine exporter family protein n=1 Tax=Auraticoccus cholistanensis TaxID=2656650 RepID=A0A6A9V124_9ACTN|nr:threonine/serine exporter family protein [Auraticoccus cholistanensis]MVA76669.1 threonine/serine exporter family protein [Auraticoccus cholistanensis]
MAPVPAENHITRTIDLCLRLGDLLMSNGAGAADVTVTMDSVARQYGLRHAAVDVTFTSLSMSYQEAEGSVAYTQMRQVQLREIDYEDLTRVDHLVSAVLAGEVDVAEARRAVLRLQSSGHQRPRWAVTLGWGVMSAGVAVMLGGDLWVVASALVTAVAIDRAQQLMSRRRLPAFYQQVAGGAIAMVFTVLVAAAGVGADPSLVVAANIIMLLSGIGFMGALQDALTGFYVTACARLLEALLSTAGIIVGVSGGLAAATLVGVDLGELAPGAATGIRALAALGIGAAVAAAGFGYASHARLRALPPIGLVAGLAVLVSAVVVQLGLGRLWSVGLAAVFVGLVGFGVARRVHVPPLVVVVSAVVPMLPGLSIYRGLSLLGEGVDGSAPEGILALVTAASIALALAAGVILGEYVAQPLAREARRLEQRLSGPRLVGPLRQRTGRSRRRSSTRPSSTRRPSTPRSSPRAPSPRRGS